VPLFPVIIYIIVFHYKYHFNSVLEVFLMLELSHMKLSLTFSPLQTCLVCSWSRLGLYHSKYWGLDGL